MAEIQKRRISLISTQDLWTNFSPANNTIDKFEIAEAPTPGYWSFKTNLTYEDLTVLMPLKDIYSFLHQMWRHYSHGSFK